MRVTLSRKRTDTDYAIIYGLLALLAVVAGRLLPLLPPLLPACTFHALTGIPCITCGSTRMLVRLAHGDLLPAAAMNPLLFAVVALGILAFFFGLARLLFHFPEVNVAFTEREKTGVRCAALLLLLSNWLYLCILL